MKNNNNKVHLKFAYQMLTLSRPKEEKTNFEKDSLKMRLSGYRLKFAELIGPWTFNHSDKKNEIFPKCIPGDTLGVKGLNFLTIFQIL